MILVIKKLFSLFCFQLFLLYAEIQIFSVSYLRLLREIGDFACVIQKHYQLSFEERDEIKWPICLTLMRVSIIIV